MVQYHFNCIDTDADGRIEFKEYLAFIKKYNWLDYLSKLWELSELCLGNCYD